MQPSGTGLPPSGATPRGAMGAPKGGGGGKGGGGKGGKAPNGERRVWSQGGYQEQRAPAGRGARPEEVRQLLSGQGLLPEPRAGQLCEQLRGLKLGYLPGVGGPEGARAWSRVSKAWSMLGASLDGQCDETEDEVWAELTAAAGGDWFAQGDPRQVERDLMRQNRYAHYLFLSLHPHLAMQRLSQQDHSDDLPRVLMVAEKPSVCKMIAEHLSGGRMRMRKGMSRACQIYEHVGWFPQAGQKCRFMTTSVVGHVFGLDFNKEDNQGAWNDPSVLFHARTEKIIEDTTAKLKVVEHLQELSKEAEYLVLWLDCDREGENIGFEVIGICREDFPSDENIYRAQFSALTEPEMKRALNTLVRPNKYMSMAVDARQELDLKIGVSFTRFLTRSLIENCRQKFYRDLKVISYGPCQTPTLWFCVERHHEIQNFQRQTFWTPKLTVDVPGVGPCQLEWGQGRTFDPQEAQDVERTCRQAGQVIVQEVRSEQKAVRRPVGLNTVQLLKAASTGMGMSPVVAMKNAEHLYTTGYISYPRTDRVHQVPRFVRHGRGKTASYILNNNPMIRPPTSGHDAGDHPPITPMRCAPRGEITKGKEWKLYDYIARHFIASLMDDFQYVEHQMVVVVGNRYQAGGRRTLGTPCRSAVSSSPCRGSRTTFTSTRRGLSGTRALGRRCGSRA
ncbi:unnamed protein product [Prorocentrum cordatum]|uniref:DNA topoisomerase n=1 Tax=Prorocentrum cordatum TaxID=2364126 RepID=A0ABN9X2B8_9DINO|nr:unnamed protein product [Polarella glacialis]